MITPGCLRLPNVNNLQWGEGMVGMKQASYCPKQLFDEAVDVSDVCLSCALFCITVQLFRRSNDEVEAS